MKSKTVWVDLGEASMTDGPRSGYRRHTRSLGCLPESFPRSVARRPGGRDPLRRSRHVRGGVRVVHRHRGSRFGPHGLAGSLGRCPRARLRCGGREHGRTAPGSGPGGTARSPGMRRRRHGGVGVPQRPGLARGPGGCTGRRPRTATPPMTGPSFGARDARGHPSLRSGLARRSRARAGTSSPRCGAPKSRESGSGSCVAAEGDRTHRAPRPSGAARRG